MKCLDCLYFRDRIFFPRTGGTAGKCYNGSSRNYRKWMVGTDGCDVKVEEQELYFNF